MATINFRGVKHRYGKTAEYALKQVDQTWEDGGAYALLGPSGCGKTTLLNCISGLLEPTEGKIFFDERDVTGLPVSERQIAQVFQFPVVYDTMTVFDNLAFPLRNRGVAEPEVKKRVAEIADMLDLSSRLENRAAGLTADGKQKISLGRGLARSDVNAILFDEPLTVIDPHLKWQLRSKLKELHQQIGVTMIYVTHDQVEALTFADKVVVMYDGAVVQTGTPVELFNRPNHTFVGYFIGSPGMNILPCRMDSGRPVLHGHALDTDYPVDGALAGKTEVGVRPEFVAFAEEGLPVTIDKVEDLGRYRVVTASHAAGVIKMIVNEAQTIPSADAKVRFDPAQTRVYHNGWLAGGAQ